MKKIIVLSLIAVMLLALVGCNSAEPAAAVVPSNSQMLAICELAVMECHYHNVAKYFQENADPGFLGIGAKDKHFWVEYDAVVKVGIDVSRVKVTVEGTDVTVTIPPAEVLSYEVNEDSLRFIVEDGSAAVTGEDESAAYTEAKAEVMQAASSDGILLRNARDRAKQLLEAYVNNIGQIAGVEYTIHWVELESEPAAQ